MSGGRLSIQRRFILGLVFCAFFMTLLAGRLFYLQTFRHQVLYTQSENNRIRIQPVTPVRGKIFDRERRVLVDNRASYTLSVVPVEVRKNDTKKKLSELLGVTEEVIDRRVKKNMTGRYQPSAIKRDVDFDVVAILEEQNEMFPGAVYRKAQARQYRSEFGGECFTGHIGEISFDEIKKLDRSVYRSGTMIGKSGIERYYDRDLRGLEGTQYLEIAASGQILGVLEDEPGRLEEHGADLVLTIDLDIQKVATESFGQFCCGAAVAIDPRNGEVLALVSNPSNDANIFSTVILDSLWQSILADTTNPLLNRPLDGLYPPASTYKLVVAGAGLELGLIDRNSVFPESCTGGYRIGNRIFHCWKRSGHGRLNLIGAIEQSCDVYFYQLGLKLGLEEYYNYSKLCGFGKKTGIDLPQEASGNVPNKQWYDKRPVGSRWTGGMMLNLSIGQGEILTTPLQLTQFFCGLANEGRVYRPHLLRSSITPDQRETMMGGELSYTLPFSKKTLEILNEALVAVGQGEHGTARGSKIPGVVMAGKTGTAQNSHGENHSWFVGFAPAENPIIVACVIIENAGDGSDWAAPAVRNIIKAYLDKKLIPKEAIAVTADE